VRCCCFVSNQKRTEQSSEPPQKNRCMLITVALVLAFVGCLQMGQAWYALLNIREVVEHTGQGYESNGQAVYVDLTALRFVLTRTVRKTSYGCRTSGRLWELGRRGNRQLYLMANYARELAIGNGTVWSVPEARQRLGAADTK